MRSDRASIADEDTSPELLKVSCLLTRRSDTPMLAKPVEGGPKVYRYVQLHPIDAGVPGLQTASYDGVAEIWLEKHADAAAMFRSEHYNSVVAKDEEQFLDRSKTVFLYSFEKRIF